MYNRFIDVMLLLLFCLRVCVCVYEQVDVRRNFAFIEFEKLACATEAKDGLNGHVIDFRTLTVEYVAGAPRYLLLFFYPRQLFLLLLLLLY